MHRRPRRSRPAEKGRAGGGETVKGARRIPGWHLEGEGRRSAGGGGRLGSLGSSWGRVPGTVDPESKGKREVLEEAFPRAGFTR